MTYTTGLNNFCAGKFGILLERIQESVSAIVHHVTDFYVPSSTSIFRDKMFLYTHEKIPRFSGCKYIFRKQLQYIESARLTCKTSARMQRIFSGLIALPNRILRRDRSNV